jgi:hypothetical protein
MRQRLRIAAILLNVGAAVAVLWCGTVHGIFERPLLDPESMYFLAGAGDGTLIVRAILILLAAVASLLAAFFPAPGRSRAPLVVSVFAIAALFVLSALSLERWAPSYSEAAFFRLLDRNSAGSTITRQQVLTALGPPLVTGRRAEGEEVWCYTYMPSCGFGWHKRVFWLRQNDVARVYFMDEP